MSRLPLFGSALLVTGVASTLITAPAQAAQLRSTTCSVNNVSIGTTTATACYGPLSGNDTGAQSTLLNNLNGGLFSNYVGSDVSWSLAGKSDDGNSLLNAQNGQSSGEWSLDQALTSGTFVLSLKTSTRYSAYLFQNIDFSKTGLVGLFNTIGVALNGNGSKGKDLSHASLFVAKVSQGEQRTEVPEPASLIGLGLAATGMVVSRRRQSK